MSSVPHPSPHIPGRGARLWGRSSPVSLSDQPGLLSRKIYYSGTEGGKLGTLPVYRKNWTKEDSALARCNEVFKCSGLCSIRYHVYRFVCKSVDTSAQKLLTCAGRGCGLLGRTRQTPQGGVMGTQSPEPASCPPGSFAGAGLRAGD